MAEYYQNEHYSLIGKIVVNFARLEEEITIAICKVTEMDIIICKVLLADIPFFRLYQKFRWLYYDAKISKPPKEVVDAVFKELDDLRILRNKIAHWLWQYDYSEEVLDGWTFTTKEIGKPIREIRLTLSELTEINPRIERSIKNVSDLLPDWKPENNQTEPPKSD